MIVELEPKAENRIAPTHILQQTAFWARLKKRQGWGVRAFDMAVGHRNHTCGKPLKPHEREGDVLITLRQLGSGGLMAYVPFGPEQLPDEERCGIWLEELSEQLHHFLPPETLFVRYDLNWESPWAGDKDFYHPNGTWKGPPDVPIREIRMNFDTRHFRLRKAPTDMLPAHTVMLNLDKDDERLLNSMKSKTRYNIRLSRRNGVKVRRAGISELPTWFRLYSETYSRHNLAANELKFFEAVFKTRACDTRSPGEVDLLLAEKEDEPLAGMFLARSGGRATYLYGASSSKQKNLMASYALQWEAMQFAKERGCDEYDFFGISPFPDPAHPMYGLYRFKTGFGGRVIHRMGCWDYPFDQESYEQFRLAEMSARGYHLK